MQGEYGELLRVMLSDMERAGPLYRPTRYWRLCSQRILDDLERLPIASFRAFPSALLHFVPTYALEGVGADPERLRGAVERLCAAAPENDKARRTVELCATGEAQAWADYRVFRASDTEGSPYTEKAGESSVGEPVGSFRFDGKRYSRSLLNYLLALNFAKQNAGAFPVRTVLEVGGGFGTLGEILLQDPRNETLYLDVDIPPTALLSTWYLQQVFDRGRVADYARTCDDDPLEIERLRRDADAAVLCAWQLPRLRGSVDLFVNSISFQEMEPEVVENYLSHVRRLEARLVLLRNLREGKQIAEQEGQLGVAQATRAEHYDRFLPGYDLVATNVVPFGFRTVDGFHSELRLYRRG